VPSAESNVTDATGREGATPPGGSWISRWRDLRPFLAVSKGALAVLILTSVLGGFAEAGVLAIVVQIAAALSVRGGRSVVELGPLSMKHAAVGTLFAFAFVLTIVRLLLQTANAYLPARIAAAVQARLRTELFAAFTSASWAVQSQEREGQLQEIMSQRVNGVASAVLASAGGVNSACSFAALVISAFIVNSVAAVIAVMAASVMFFALRPLSQLTRRFSARFVAANLLFASGLSEAVRVAEETQVFGVGPAQRRQMGGLIEAVRRPFFRTQLVGRLVGPLYQGLSLLLVVAGLAGLYAAGSDQFASLGAVVLILIRALSYSQGLQNTHQTLAEQLPVIELVRHTLARYQAAAVTDGGHPLERADTVEFSNVEYSYVPGRRVIRAVSFAVARGEAIGIVGPSGAGKSTLVQILLRLRSPQEGQLLINGKPAEDFGRADWFARIAYVPQEGRLLAATVADNIRFYRDWLGQDRIEEAARHAHIHDEIVTWAEGYDTVIGDRQNAVSGGQRQRLCIARALAARPDILVLDEPTSALDGRSEALLQETLAALKGDVTVFLIAHRLSTLNLADRIMVIRGGVVEAFDDPVSLLRSNEFYRRAVQLANSHGSVGMLPSADPLPEPH
jgi:ATP-binding cassette subfamily B protein